MLNKIIAFLPNLFSFFTGFFIAKKQADISQLKQIIEIQNKTQQQDEKINNLITDSNSINTSSKRVRIKKRKAEYNKQ